MSIIEVRNVSRAFNNGKQVTEVLKDINLTVDEGDFVSIMGPSGSGKSTLLYLLGGLDTPTTGSVSINGRDLSTLKDKQLSSMRNEEIGFVFQFYNLVPNLNVVDNISLPLMLGNAFQMLYNMVDSVVLGQFVSKQALAAVSSTTMIVNLFVFFFSGFATAASRSPP